MFRKYLFNIYTLIVIVSIVAVGLIAFGFNALKRDNVIEKGLVTRVIDGDTIEINSIYHVRYIGIDTPEEDEYYFNESKEFNSELVLGKEVRLERDVSQVDKYNRLLRYVYVGDLFVNAELVRLGYANAVRYLPDEEYSDYFADLEQYARASGLGIHTLPANEPRATVAPSFDFPLLAPSSSGGGTLGDLAKSLLGE